jgi:hypothetical protein
LILGLFGKKERRTAVADYPGLLDFLDSRSAFLSQKCVYEYCRARSGLNWEPLMREAAFIEAYNASRWDAYAAALSDLVILMEGRLRPADTRQHARLVDRLLVAAAEVLARHRTEAERQQGWGEEIGQLRDRLNQAQLGPPRPAAEIAKVGGRRIYETLPLHADMTKHDRELVTNAVRFNFSRIAADLEGELDVAKVQAAILAEPPPAGGPAPPR